jgi:hypothetical protein
MKFIKNYKLFESYSETGFDNIYNYSYIENSLIKEINNHNNNFNPNIIKDLFIEFIDNHLIEDIVINKIYEKVESTKINKGITKPASYIRYVIKINFKLNDKYSDKFYELRKEYLKERDEIRDILREHFNHKSLNSGLSEYTLYNNDNYIFTRNKDSFDLFSKCLWLKN